MSGRGYGFLELVLGLVSLTLARRTIVLCISDGCGKQESEKDSEVLMTNLPASEANRMYSTRIYEAGMTFIWTSISCPL
jgi:hypothetical protein